MIKEGSRVEITFGTFEGKQGVVTLVDNRNRSVIVLVDGTKIEIEKGIKQEVKEIQEGNALEQFLAQWKAAAAKYYTQLRKEVVEIKNSDYEINEENLKSLKNHSGKRKLSDSKIEKLLSGEMLLHEERNFKISIRRQAYQDWAKGKTAFDLNFVDMMGTIDNYLEPALESMAKEKELHFMARVEKKAGEILDMSGLTLGFDGSINGTVIGKEKTVTVKTVFAGGHNVQCLHYRVMVK